MNGKVTMVRCAVALGLTLLAPIPTPSHAADEFQPVRELVRARMQQDEIPSVAIAVARNGRIVWEQGFGFADLENRTRATPHTVYRICSISKAFTGTAIMLLAEEGKVNLDRPVNDYLGESKLTARVGKIDDATVRRVANHTSGLPTHDQSFFEGEHYQQQPSDDMETLITRYGNVVWLPGERCNYSNIGMGVLSHVVALQSQSSFAEFMEQRVFGPLGMMRSSIRLNHETKPYAAKAYFQGQRIPTVTNSTSGAGEVWCSAHDLIRFALLHLKTPLPNQSSILSDHAIEAMQVETARAHDSGYGVGWGVSDDYRGTGYRVVGHHGGNVGWHSFLLLIPSEDVAVAVLANASGNIVDPIVDRTLAVVVPDFQRRLEAAANPHRGKEKNPSDHASQDAGPMLTGKWQGQIHTYAGVVPVTFWIEDQGMGHAKVGEQERIKLKQLQIGSGRLTADLDATIRTSDTDRQPPGILEVDLTLRDDELNGVIYANSLYGNPAWGGYRLNHWTSLKRVP